MTVTSPASDGLSLINIEAASDVIDPSFLHTPQLNDVMLADRLGTDMLVKVETLNPVRSFKGRGAAYCLSAIEPEVQVVCASAGNFGQAIAYAGLMRDIPVTVFAATSANPTKVARMRTLGAEVILTGRDFDEAKTAARALAAERTGAIFLEDGEHPRIAEGAGTIGIELAPAEPDTVLIPVGNGALISGVGCWLKAHSPRTRIVGVTAAGAPAMAVSWQQGRPVPAPQARTMADGVAVRVPVPAAVAWMSHYVDDMLLVDEDHILQALRVVRDTLGLILEPAGALGIAAVLQHDIPGERQATVLTGSNFSPDLIHELT